MFSRWGPNINPGAPCFSCFCGGLGSRYCIHMFSLEPRRTAYKQIPHICLLFSDLPRPLPPPPLRLIGWVVGGIHLSLAHTCIKPSKSKWRRRSAFRKYPLPLLLTCHGFLNGSTNSPPGTHGKEKRERVGGERKKERRKKKKKNRTRAPSSPVVIFTSLYDSI